MMMWADIEWWAVASFWKVNASFFIWWLSPLVILLLKFCSVRSSLGNNWSYFCKVLAAKCCSQQLVSASCLNAWKVLFPSIPPCTDAFPFSVPVANSHQGWRWKNAAHMAPPAGHFCLTAGCALRTSMFLPFHSVLIQPLSCLYDWNPFLCVSWTRVLPSTEARWLPSMLFSYSQPSLPGLVLAPHDFSTWLGFCSSLSTPGPAEGSLSTGPPSSTQMSATLGRQDL